MRKKILVVGGGITGLSAAFSLQQAKERGADIEYLLVEKEPKLGGKIITDTIDGFVIEGGPDCFMAEKPSVLQLTKQLGIEDTLLPSNESSAGTFIFSAGKLQRLPDGLMLLVPNKFWPFITSPLISWAGKLRMGMDFFIPKKQDKADETLGGFVKRRLGQEALDKIGEPMIGGIHGGNPDNMSLQASFPRFMKMEEDYGSLAIAMIVARYKMSRAKAKAQKLQANKPKPAGKAKSSYFMSYNGGMYDLVEGIYAKLKSNCVLTGTSVERIEKILDGDASTKYLVKLSNQQTIEFDAVILANPSDVSARLLKEIDSDISENLLQIPLGSSACISLVYKRSDVPNKLTGFGFVIPFIEGRKINAVTYTSMKWDCRVPDDDHIMIRSFVGKPQNQAPALQSEEDIETNVRAELKEILGITAKPLVTKVHKWTKGRPQYILGHLERMQVVENKLKKHHPGLVLAGACYHGIGVPDCVSDGIKSAEATLNFLK